jgi:hypothetical protein
MVPRPFSRRGRFLSRLGVGDPHHPLLILLTFYAYFLRKSRLSGNPWQMLRAGTPHSIPER